jgi:hypothetical protein
MRPIPFALLVPGGQAYVEPKRDHGVASLIRDFIHWLCAVPNQNA